MTWVGTIIIVVKMLILPFDSGITYIAFKAYRRTGSPSLRVLGIGFGAVTFGALLAEIATQLFSVSLEAGVLINSVLVAIGFYNHHVFALSRTSVNQVLASEFRKSKGVCIAIPIFLRIDVERFRPIRRR